ncbi:MAG: ATP-dependent Clp protease proteolytic subunit [Bdellovibrionota bacterium]
MAEDTTRSLNVEYENSTLGAALSSHLQDSKLVESRKIFMFEGVNANVAKRVNADLLILDSMGNEPIDFFINSPGGEVNSGFAIFDTIRFIKSPVRIINAGLCASIATIINIATKKELRFSLPNSRFLIHQPLIMGQIQGQASDLEITAKQILQTRAKINKLLALECGQSLEKVSEDTIRDYWMSAEEAKDYGLITHIIDSHDQLK